MSSTTSRRPNAATSSGRSRTGRAAAALLALAAPLLAGCGGSSSPLSSVTSAVHTSLSHTFGGRVTLVGADALGAGPSTALHAAGLFDAGRGLAYERVDVPGPLDANKVPPRDFLVFRRTDILLSPAAQSALPTGKTVISVPLAGTPRAVRAGPFVEQAMAVNPLLLLDELANGSVAATKTGSEVVAHVPFVDYRVTVDLQRALAGVRGPFAAAERRAVRGELAALGQGRTFQILVRTDGAGFVRELHTSIPGSRLGHLAFDLHSYGVKFEPSYPAATQVVPIGSLAGAWAWSPHWPWRFGS